MAAPQSSPFLRSSARRGVLLALAVLSSVLLVAAAHGRVSADAPRNFLSETPHQRDARLKWWRDARFGMFIHWGVYAVPAGTYQGRQIPGIGEWIMASANIPPPEYARFPPQFNPVQFDAAKWVRIAKDAGMKYVVITSKHHDGFALFDSKVSDWDIVDRTPYKRDVLKALSRECKKAGLKFCVYYSILDWHHPSQQPNPKAANPHASLASNSMKDGRKAEYLQYMKGQLRELLKNYDPGVLWFDGEWVEWWTEEDGKALYNYLRGIKPNLIVNNRIGKGRKGMEGLTKGEGYAGDFGTPEQQIPPTGLPGVDWESCMTMNETWGFKSFDHDWKTPADLIRKLVDIASKGGNFLLNVGPTAEGLIPQPSVERLAAVGKWTRVNGEAIYGTSASPFPKQLPWGRATSRPGKLYLHVFDWPAGGRLTVSGLDSRVKRAYLLSDAKRAALPVTQSHQELTVTLPAQAPDPIATVVVLQVR